MLDFRCRMEGDGENAEVSIIKITNDAHTCWVKL